jgi:MFS family permease
MIGLFMVLPILVVYGQDLTGATPILLGLALGIYGLTQSLLQIPLGLLSDHIGRKPVMLAGLVIFAMGSLVAAFAESALTLIIGRALQGAGAIAGVVMALLADSTRSKNQSDGNCRDFDWGLVCPCAHCRTSARILGWLENGVLEYGWTRGAGNSHCDLAIAVSGDGTGIVDRY